MHELTCSSLPLHSHFVYKKSKSRFETTQFRLQLKVLSKEKLEVGITHKPRQQMEPCNHMNGYHSCHRKREKASRKQSKARKGAETEHHHRNHHHTNANANAEDPLNPAFGGYAYQRVRGPFNHGYGYGYGYPSHNPHIHRQYYQYRYGKPRRYLHYDEYVAMAPPTYRNGYNEFGTLHFADTDPYLCYQVHYETPIMPFPQAPPPRKLHPFYTPESVCAIM